MELDIDNAYGAKLMEYAGKHRNHNISILVDRMPLTREDHQLLAALFPKGQIVLCDELCVLYGCSFYELTAECIENNDIYLILETSAGRVDHLVKQLLKKGVCENAILTGVSEYRKQTEIGQLLRMQHFDSSVCNADTFSRYAIVIRYLFIEAWAGRNSQGYTLYREYLDAKKYGPYDDRKEKFEALLQSFQANGAQNLWIAVDAYGRIIDGSHRLAICMYLGIRHVQVRYMNTSERLYSDRQWLSQHFSDQAQETVVKKYHELASKYLQHPSGHS